MEQDRILSRGLWAFSLALGGLAVSCGSASPPAEESVGEAEQPITCVTIQTGTLGGFDDAYVRASTPNLNFGSAANLLVGAVAGVTHGTLLRADLSSIPTNATINSASLTLFRNLTSGPGVLSAYGVQGAWNEATVTWNTLPPVSGVVQAFVNLTPSPPTSTSLNITGITQGWVSGAIPNQGIWLSETSGGAQFASDDVGFPVERPKLDVCYTLPPTCTDGTQNGLETGVDCGGPVCPSCCIPSAEICDGLDNDCNGLIDEGNPGGGAACGAFPGACGGGTTACVAGQIACSQTPLPPSTGSYLLAGRAGDPKNQTGLKVASDAAGNIALTGYFYSTINFGGGNLVGTQFGLASDQYVAMLDASGGHLWSKSFAATSYLTPTGLAVDCGGDVLLAGYYDGSVDFGGGPLVSAGNNEVYVAKLDAAGNHLWSKRFGDAQYQYAWDLAADSTGAALVTGAFDGTVDFGGGVLTAAGGEDIFLAKLDAAGNHVWSKRIGGTGYDFAYNVAVDGADRVLLTGYFQGSVDFGGTTLTSVSGADAFIAVYDASGNLAWVKQYGTTSTYASFYAIAGDAAGNVHATGSFGGTFDFGGGPLSAGGTADDLFVMKLDAAGNFQWSQAFGSVADYEDTEGIAVDSEGGVVVGGRALSLSPYNYDGLVVKLDLSGNLVWSRQFGDTAYQATRGIGLDPSGNVLITGELDGSADFGGGLLTSAGGTDVFVAKYAP